MKKFYFALLLSYSSICYSQTACPGMDSIYNRGIWYHTVQIGDQCWLKENMNAGTMIFHNQNETNNQVIEKYCYHDNALYCSVYGGLYSWNEAMQYENFDGAVGICPSSWHIPSSLEYAALKANVGNDGNALKKIGQGSGNGLGTDTSGFSALLAGGHDKNGNFFWFGNNGYFWSSTGNDSRFWPLSMQISYDSDNINIWNLNDGSSALSIRCIKDNYGFLLLNSPNGGEQWLAGSNQFITWTENNLTNIRIQYSPNNGTNWNTITYSTPASAGSYNWKVPNITCNSCKIRIIDNTNIHTISTSSNVFSIIPYERTVKLLSPVGGEQWIADSVYNITWSQIRVNKIKLEYTINNGITWIGIADSVPALSGIYNWRTPKVNSNKCKVRITDVDSVQKTDMSNSLFTLYIFPYDAPYCPGLDSINYSGQWYHTVQIGNQCWLKENLNIGTEVSVVVNQSNNDTVEKYCYGDDPANCIIYGGLHQWREAVQYTRQSTPRGICPIGWHIPSLAEFTTLASTAGGDGNALKKVGQAGGTNTSGFSALLMGGQARFWSSDNFLSHISNNGTYNLNAGLLLLGTDAGINIIGNPSNSSVDYPTSIRCLKDTTGLLLRSPIGGESWIVGSKHKISWGGNLAAKKIKIDYSTNNGAGWIQIIDSTPAIDGDYDWTIPNTPALCNIRITDLNNPNSFAISYNVGIYINPCPADSIIHFGDHNYHTISIGSKCWLRENVNEGIMIPGSREQTPNGILEKYCYNDDTANCTTYGGLYKASETGEPGMCPTGWHIPYDNSFYDLLSDVIYDGNALKAVGQGAGGGAGTNTSGFSLLLAGTRNSDGTFSNLGYQTWIQHIFGLYSTSGIMYIRDDFQNILVGSVRCIREEVLGVRSPFGGEFWQTGTVHKITWAYSNVKNIKIEYTTDNGLNWINIIGSVPVTDSSYSWTIPNTPARICNIRLSNVDNPGIISITKNFTIYPSLPDPCLGISTMNYGGKLYHTVAIGGLCWFKENLDIGIMIDSLKTQTNNQIIEKYCYKNDTANCNKFGGLYQWNEAMQYKTTTDAQGICPLNWYIPTQDEFMGLLGGSVNYDGSALKDVTAGGTNTSGFSGLMSGYRYMDGSFNSLGLSSGYWSSSQYYDNTSYAISLVYNDFHIPVLTDPVSIGFSVRCMHDFMVVPVELLSFTAYVINNNIKLNWNTATEVNTSSFDIERRSANSNNWEMIGSVRAAGNSTAPKQYSFLDKNVNTGKYVYRLRIVDLDGSFKYSSFANAEVAAPLKFELANAYPNPWNPATTIRYQVPVNILVTIKVFDAIGKEVSTLVNEVKTAGSYDIIFNGKGLTSGVYYYQMKAGNFIETKKIILLK